MSASLVGIKMPEVEVVHNHVQRVTNNDDIRALTLVQNWQPFRNSTGSLRGNMVKFRHPHDEDIESVYVVASYETPIYVCQITSGHWYGTQEKFSHTTTRHQSIAKPSKDVAWVNTALLRKFATVGFRYMSAVRVIRGEMV